MSLYLVVLYCVVAICALFATQYIRHLSLKNNFLDIPNERSSHSVAVPQGGGLAIVTLSFLTLIYLFVIDDLSYKVFYPLIFSLVSLSVVGWADDKYRLSITIRLLVQLFVTVITLYFIGGINNINIIHIDINIPGYIGYLLAVVWVVGFINMYNFMDGIDGFIGLHSVISGILIAIWFVFFREYELAVFSLVLSAASLGFLYWNFSPAKIFCGDVGSTTLGGVFAILGLYLHNINGMSIVFYSGLFLFFMIDAAFTISKRALRGDKIWLPHREHIYQRLSVKYQSHAVVTIAVAIFSLVIGSLFTYYMWLYYVNY